MLINRVRRLNDGRYGVIKTLREELRTREWGAQDKKAGIVRPSNPKK